MTTPKSEAQSEVEEMEHDIQDWLDHAEHLGDLKGLNFSKMMDVAEILAPNFLVRLQQTALEARIDELHELRLRIEPPRNDLETEVYRYLLSRIKSLKAHTTSNSKEEK